MSKEVIVAVSKTYVVKLLGNVRKNCLCVVSSNDTMRVANKSRVSYNLKISAFPRWYEM